MNTSTIYNKWWCYCWTTTIGISLTSQTLLASIFFLLLNFTIVSSKQLDNNTTLSAILPKIKRFVQDARPTQGPGEF